MAILASDWLRHFRLLLWNRSTEFNETWQEARSRWPLPSLCFSGRSEKQDGRSCLWLAETFSTSPLKPLNGIQRNLTGSKISTSSTKFVFFGPIGKNKMAVLASDWLRHFRLLLWNRSTEFNETWQVARSQRPLPILCFSGRSEKQDGRPGLWLAETFSTSPLKRPNRIQPNLIGSKISTSSTKFVFFGPIGKTRWPPWPLIGWDIFDFSSETAQRNSTKLDRKQDLNVVYQVCVCRDDWKNKMAALASDWLRHFRLLLWNRWREFDETWQEARSQRRLPSLCFFGPIGKTRWPPWLLIGWDIFDFSSEITERNSKKLDRKQDLNVLYQVCVFRADRKNKMAALASDWPRLFDFSSETAGGNSTKLDRKQDLNVLYQVCVFRADRKNKMAALASDWLRHFYFSSVTAEQNSMSSTKFVFFRPISKQKCPHLPIFQRGGTLYSGARYVALWASCFIFTFYECVGEIVPPECTLALSIITLQNVVLIVSVKFFEYKHSLVVIVILNIKMKLNSCIMKAAWYYK